MAGLLNKALGRKQPPPRVLTDRVLTVSLWDGNPSMSRMQGWTMLRFEVVLDPIKLRDALTKLVNIGDWRKLGGRFRRNKDGQLEIHIPQEFTDERPAIGFSHQDMGCRIDEHRLGRKLPRTTPDTNRSCVHHGPTEDFLPLASSRDTPRSFDEYLVRDIPSLWLHVSSFTDATTVALTWPHAVMDGTGLSCVLQAWAFVLAGQEKLLPDVLSTKHDLMGALSADEGVEGVPEERYFLLDRLMAGAWRMFLYVIIVTLRMLFAGSVETRMVFLPKSTVTKLRQEALATLEMDDKGSASGGSGNGTNMSGRGGSGHGSASSSSGRGLTEKQEKKLAEPFIPGGIVADRRTGTPFISDSDALTAYFTRMATRVLGVRSRRTVNIITLFNVRDRIPAFTDKLQGKGVVGVHLANVCMAVQALLPANAVIPGAAPTSTLGGVAAAVRAHIAAATTQPQLRAFARLQDAVQKSSRKAMFPILGDLSNLTLVFSSLDVGPMYEINVFEPAVVKPAPVVGQVAQGGGTDAIASGGEKKEAAALAAAVGLHKGSTPIGFLVAAESRGIVESRIPMFILGRGKDGTWVQGALPPALWKVVEEELAEIDRR